MLGRELLGVGIREIKGIPPKLSGGAKLKTKDVGELVKELCPMPHRGKRAKDIGGKQQNSTNLV